MISSFLQVHQLDIVVMMSFQSLQVCETSNVPQMAWNIAWQSVCKNRAAWTIPIWLIQWDKQNFICSTDRKMQI